MKTTNKPDSCFFLMLARLFIVQCGIWQGRKKEIQSNKVGLIGLWRQREREGEKKRKIENMSYGGWGGRERT